MKNPPRDGASRRKRNSAVETNDRFMKVSEVLEDTRNVWLVSHKLDLEGLPPHVRIVDERAPQRSVTVAESALLDKRLYHRLESAPRRRMRLDQEQMEPGLAAGGQSADVQEPEGSEPTGQHTRAQR